MWGLCRGGVYTRTLCRYGDEGVYTRLVYVWGWVCMGRVCSIEDGVYTWTLTSDGVYTRTLCRDADGVYMGLV